MISPSDKAASVEGSTAAGTIWNDSWRKGSVLPLEFKAIDHPLRRRTDWMVGSEDDLTSQDARLREEFVSLEARLRLQTLQQAQELVEAKAEARLEARSEWSADLSERITAERTKVGATCAEFARARAAYFVSVEAEVVRLALAIATRILNREAKLDPLLLSAVVRMALEKVAEDSGAVLHVPAGEAEQWRAMLAVEGQGAVTVLGDDRMSATECVLETSVGRVELGVVAQLEEVEKGFFDLLQQRPL